MRQIRSGGHPHHLEWAKKDTAFAQFILWRSPQTLKARCLYLHDAGHLHGPGDYLTQVDRLANGKLFGMEEPLPPVGEIGTAERFQEGLLHGAGGVCRRYMDGQGKIERHLEWCSNGDVV